MAEFSIDDVYKQAPAAAKGGEISLDEAYGGKTPGLSGGTKPEPQGRSAGDWAMRSVKDIPAIADMVLGLPGMGLQLGAEALGRLHGVIEGGLAGMSGKDPQARKRADAYGVAAKESVPESFSAPLQTLLKTFGLDASGSNLEAVMGTAMTAMHKGGQYVERVTKGGVTAEDSDMLLNTLMFSLGAKGVGGQLKKAMEPKPPEGQFKGPYKGKLDPPKPPKPETPPPFEPYGVRQPAGMPTTEASKAQTAQRRADVRAAFAEEPQWADYLKRQADYQAETLAKREAESTRLTPEESAPRTRPPERTSVDDAPKDLYTTKGAPNKGPQPGYVQNPAGLWVPDTRSPELKVAGSALDSGLAKLGQGRGFDLTAAERSAVNKSGSSWNRPEIVLPSAGKRTQMFGGADQNTMVGLATLGLGAVVGANLDKDNPIIGALLGMTGAAGAKYVGTKGAVSLAKAVVGDNKGRAAATITSGALAGYVVSDDKNKTSGTILGALAVGAARALPKYTGLRIGQELNARDYLAQSFNVEAMRLQFGILDKVPDVERLKAIWRANEPGGSAKDLSPAEREVAQAFRTYYAGMDKAAKEAGVYKEGLDNYMARLHDLDPKSVEFELQKLFDKTGKNGGNPFSKERRFLTLEDAKKAGYTPVTENPVEMLGIYANSMGKAIADRNLVKGLMEKNVPESKDAKYVMAEKYAPRTYVSMPGAAMGGKRVHPDLEGSLKFVFESRNPSAALRAVETFNAATKRIAVMVSLFHAKSLLDAAVGAVKVNKGYLLGGAAVGGMAGLLADDPTTGAQIGAGLGMLAGVGKTGGLAATGTLKYLQELKRGGQGGVIERAMKGGLEFSMEEHPSIVEDTGGGNFYAGMADAGKLLDKTLEGAGKHTFGNLIKVNQIFDNFMWARLHTGLKLSVFDEKFNTIKENNARAHEKAPDRVKLLGEDEIAHIAGSFTNDTFGGLNWRRIAEGAETRLGRAVGEAVLSPTGRRAQQLLMFAPDWTLSTTRAFTGAFGEGSGIKGLLNPRELADLHRQYIIRSALFYALAGDGINYAMSGHHLWDNRDWTRLELGDGRTMQFSKHMMEPYHWLMHPAQQAMNKLSHPVKETANQMLGTEYLAPRTNRNGERIAGPAMKGTRVEHLVGSVSPIAAQQSANSGAVGGAAGFLGFPIYGQTKDQREEEKRKRQLERIKEQVR